MTSLRWLRADRRLRLQVVAYAAARMPGGMMLLALLLHLREKLGDVTSATRAVAVYGIAVALFGPFTGRAVDRWGARRVLPIVTAVHVAGIAELLVGHGAVALAAGAAIAGAGLPPTAACLRAGWQGLAEETRRAVFALDGVIVEVAGLLGPLLVSAATLAGGTGAALVAAAAFTTGAAAAALPLLPAAEPARSPRQWLGPVRAPGVLPLLGVVVAVTAAIAILEVSAVSFTAARHQPTLAGLLFAAMTVGSIVGGLLYAVRPTTRPAANALPWLCLLTSLAFLLPSAGTGSTWMLAITFTISNVFVAPLFAVLFTTLGDAAPQGQTTETFTWVSTANFAAISAGTAAGGVLLLHLRIGLAMLAAPALMVAAAAIAHGARTARARATFEPDRAN